MYYQIVFLIILIGIVMTICKYSQEGDILTHMRGCPSTKELKGKYSTSESIVDRLHQLLVYKENYVKWNHILLISLFVSIVLLHFFKREITISELILVAMLIFFAIDLPNRWIHAHVQSGVIQEATQLRAIYS